MTSSLHISTIKFPLSLSKLTLEGLINKELSNIAWKDNLEVTKVVINGAGEEIKLYLDIKSFYDGSVQVSFKPIFDKVQQRLVLENLKVELADKGMLAKGLNWILKGFAKEKLITTIQSQLDDKISTLTQKFINKAINLPVAKVLNLNLNCQEMDLRNIRFEQEVLHMDVELEGRVRLDSIDS